MCSTTSRTARRSRCSAATGKTATEAATPAKRDDGQRQGGGSNGASLLRINSHVASAFIHRRCSGFASVRFRSIVRTSSRSTRLPSPSLGRERQRIDRHSQPLRPRTTQHDHEALPVGMHVVVRVVGAGIICLQNRDVTDGPRAVPQVETHGDESSLIPIEQFPAIRPPPRIPSSR